MTPLKIFLILSVAIHAGAETKQLLNETSATSLHSLIQPTEDELIWRSIPWHADLWSARREAARLGKPIYLWEMDGHPLGCT